MPFYLEDFELAPARATASPAATRNLRADIKAALQRLIAPGRSIELVIHVDDSECGQLGPAHRRVVYRRGITRDEWLVRPGPSTTPMHARVVRTRAASDDEQSRIPYAQAGCIIECSTEEDA